MAGTVGVGRTGGVMTTAGGGGALALRTKNIAPNIPTRKRTSTRALMLTRTMIAIFMPDDDGRPIFGTAVGVAIVVLQ